MGGTELENVHTTQRFKCQFRRRDKKTGPPLVGKRDDRDSNMTEVYKVRIGKDEVPSASYSLSPPIQGLRGITENLAVAG